MNKINFAGACLLAFGGFLEANALKVQSKLAQAQEDHPKPQAGGFAQMWHSRPDVNEAAQTADPVRSLTWNHPVRVTFDNDSGDQIELFWHDYSGNLVSYGHIAGGQTMQMYTYATHPWSATGSGGEYSVDGHDIFVPEAQDNDRVITIQKETTDYACDTSVNWMNNGPSYNQISLTDGCGTGNCAGNPVYAADGHTTNQDQAIAYCQDRCDERASNPAQGCEGFFFQKHNNGHEICGFYATGMEQGERVWGGHQGGAICERSTFSYELVSSGDCVGAALIETVEECQAAIKEVFGVENASVQTWDTPAYARGCFKHNYGNPGSQQAQDAPTSWIFNLNGGPGTSGHCTGEPGYAACICRED